MSEEAFENWAKDFESKFSKLSDRERMIARNAWLTCALQVVAAEVEKEKEKIKELRGRND